MLYLLEIQEEDKVSYAVSLVPSDIRDIPSEGIIGRAKTAKNPILPGEFTPNPEFLKFLHNCVERFGPLSPNLKKEAARQVNGLIYVIDARNRTPIGDVPPEDIIGAFEVRGSQVHPETYRANPNYRLLTLKGFFILDKFIEEKLLEALNKPA